MDRNKILDIDYLTPLIEEALQINVIVGPSLMAVGDGGFTDDVYAMIQEDARYLTALLWNSPDDAQLIFGSAPHDVIEHCMIEMLSSTAAFYSHSRLGELRLNANMVSVARSLCENLVRNHSPHHVLQTNAIVNFYDDALAIRHYKVMSKADFTSGILHRPSVRYDLEYEMNTMLEQGSAEFVDNDENHIQLTSLGLEKLDIVSSFLTDSGFLKRRASLMRLAKFSSLENYDELIESLGPVAQMRSDLLGISDIRPGMRVLELGCGTGIFTIDAGLCKLIEPGGSIVATDPSIGMLRKGIEKATRQSVSNVEFKPMAAEELYFDDDSFDAVVGVGFLHFTNIEQAMSEIYRVLKPGGLFSSIHGLRFAQSNPLIPDWFDPLLKLSSPARRSDSLPEPETAPEIIKRKFDIVTREDRIYIANYSVPEHAVQFFVEVINAFEDSMNQLPWRAQKDMLTLLVTRGYDMVAKYTEEELHPKQPTQLITAVAVK